MQWPKEQTKIFKTLHRKLIIEQHEPIKNRWELMCSGKRTDNAMAKRTNKILQNTTLKINHWATRTH